MKKQLSTTPFALSSFALSAALLCLQAGCTNLTTNISTIKQNITHPNNTSNQVNDLAPMSQISQKSTSFGSTITPAREIFGVKIGENIENYDYEEIVIEETLGSGQDTFKRFLPPHPIPQMSDYYIIYEKNERIAAIMAKGQFKTMEVCDTNKAKITKNFELTYGVKAYNLGKTANRLHFNDDSISVMCLNSFTDKGKVDLYIEYSSILTLPNVQDLFGVPLNKTPKDLPKQWQDQTAFMRYTVTKPKKGFDRYGLKLDPETGKTISIIAVSNYADMESCLHDMANYHEQLEYEYQMQMVEIANGWRSIVTSRHYNRTAMQLNCYEFKNDFAMFLSLSNLEK